MGRAKQMGKLMGALDIDSEWVAIKRTSGDRSFLIVQHKSHTIYDTPFDQSSRSQTTSIFLIAP